MLTIKPSETIKTALVAFEPRTVPQAIRALPSLKLSRFRPNPSGSLHSGDSGDDEPKLEHDAFQKLLHHVIRHMGTAKGTSTSDGDLNRAIQVELIWSRVL